MTEKEIKPRFICDTQVHYATYHRVTKVANTPYGTVGLMQKEAGRVYIDLLDKEIENKLFN